MRTAPLPALLLAATCLAAPARAGDFTLDGVIGFPFVTSIAAAPSAPRVAYASTLRGVRNIFVADAGGAPRAVTRNTEDDGQELTGLTFAPDGKTLLYVRGGDHDANFPAAGNLAPNPARAASQPKVTIYAADPDGARPPRPLTDGDAPAISAAGQVAYVKDGAIWSMGLDGSSPHQMFFDRGKCSAATFSPDGKRLAFVSDRGDHALIGVFTLAGGPIVYLAPSTGTDSAPVFSPDGRRIAFLRRPAFLETPETIGQPLPRPWSVMVADPVSGEGAPVWHDGAGRWGSFPADGDTVLKWTGPARLLFKSDPQGWPHLYSLDIGTNAPKLLTPGAFMVEDVAVSPDGATILYSANTGDDAGDRERRHVFSVPADGTARPMALNTGEIMSWGPAAAKGATAYVAAGPRTPPHVVLADATGGHGVDLPGPLPPGGFPAAGLQVPQAVQFPAADGAPSHGVLFVPAGGSQHPAVIFLHGGPPRQMLLGWHYMEYYSNAYAVNQYLAAHGFVVLALNYRLGIGYGHEYNEPAHAGPAGAAEYQDLLGAAAYLRTLPGVDAARIGLWGGSYGGYLTALGLARNSDIFRAGVDLHGVHDWSRYVTDALPPAPGGYDQPAREAALKLAWESSPDSALGTWHSPVLLIAGDDDRNVPINQTTDLAARLLNQHVAFQDMLIPNEIHGFLRFATWRKVDDAIVSFLTAKLRP